MRTPRAWLLWLLLFVLPLQATAAYALGSCKAARMASGAALPHAHLQGDQPHRQHQGHLQGVSFGETAAAVSDCAARDSRGTSENPSALQGEMQELPCAALGVAAPCLAPLAAATAALSLGSVAIPYVAPHIATPDLEPPDHPPRAG